MAGQSENLKIGSAVLIKDKTQLVPAKITEVQPGKDKIIRAVTIVKGDRTQLKRPIRKLIPLPIQKSLENDQLQTSCAGLTKVEEER